MALYPKIHAICKCRDNGDAAIKKGLGILSTKTEAETTQADATRVLSSLRAKLESNLHSCKSDIKHIITVHRIHMIKTYKVLKFSFLFICLFFSTGNKYSTPQLPRLNFTYTPQLWPTTVGCQIPWGECSDIFIHT